MEPEVQQALGRDRLIDITTTAEVTAVDQERRRATVSTTCTNQTGEQVLVGEAEVLLDAYPFVG